MIPRARVPQAWLFLALFFTLPPHARADMATSSDRASALLKELHEAPAVRYVSEEEIEQMGREFRQADALLTARMEGVVIARMGGPVPMTRVFLKDAAFQSGAPDPGMEGKTASFLYRQSPDTISAYKGQRVIAVLKYSDAKSRTLFITRVVPADKTSLQLLVDAIRGREKKEGAESCAEDPEVPVCEA